MQSSNTTTTTVVDSGTHSVPLNRSDSEVLKQKLHQRIKGAKLKRATKAVKMETLETECSKLGIDASKLIEQQRSQQKK